LAIKINQVKKGIFC